MEMGGSMIYDVINPSDPITIECEDEKIAQAAILLLGRGRLGLCDEEGRDVLPVFLLASDEYVDSWIIEHGIGDGFWKRHLDEIANCLDSCVVGDISDRKGVLAAISKEEDYRAALERWNDAMRSSLNDIAGTAFKLADQLRNQLEADDAD
jgi:hypothetical protein